MTMKRNIIAALAFVLVLSFVMSGCSNEKKIIGSWMAADSFINVEYTFNEDSTGSMTAFGVTVDTKYTFTKDVLTLTYSIMNIDTTEVYTVSFNESGHLILTSDDGSSETYIKK